MKTAAEKLKKTEYRSKRAWYQYYGVTEPWQYQYGSTSRRRDKHFARINIVLTKRIFRVAREAGVQPSGNPGPGHTCLGTVAGALNCAKCLARKVPLIPLNSWAKLQDEKRAASQPAPVKARKAKNSTRPHCGGVL